MCTQAPPHHSCGAAPYAPLPTNPPENDAVSSISNCSSPIHSLAMLFTSWLNRRRVSRCLFLFLCSPFLIPLLCATCPLILSAEIYFRLCRRGRRRRGKMKSREGFDAPGGGGDGLRRCEEGRCDGKVLLHRYLQDQLVLVVESVYNDCGEVDDGNAERANVEYSENRSPLLQ